MNWKGKKVLVTGCSGVIGRHLVRQLLEQGAIVRGIDMNNFPTEDKTRAFDFLQKDLLQLNPINVLSFEPEIVFHLAAAFERSEENVEFWQNNYMNNLLASHQIIDCLRYSPSVTKFIFASSYLVYDCGLYTSSSKSSKPRALKEDDIKNPRNLTGAAKYYAEKEIEFFQKNLSRKIQCAHARIYRVYGEGSKDIISRWARAALKKETLSLYGSENCFDYIYAGDVAQALVRLAATNYTGAVNVGTGQSTSVGEVVEHFRELFKDLKVKQVKSDGDFEKSSADMKLFKQLTSWIPSTGIRQGIEQIIRYEKQN